MDLSGIRHAQALAVLRRLWATLEFDHRQDMDDMREALDGLERELAIAERAADFAEAAANEWRRKLENAETLLADAESLIRYLRTDLHATRPRTDDLLRRMEEFSRV